MKRAMLASHTASLVYKKICAFSSALCLCFILSSCDNKHPAAIVSPAEQTKQIEKPHHLTPEEIAQAALAYTVKIIVQDRNQQTLGLGSGFIIKDGNVVTNLHVIRGAKYAIVNVDKEKFNVKGYLAIDNKNDLALLSVPLLPQLKEYPVIDTTLPSVGAKIFSVGSPEGLEGTFAEGSISALRELGDRSLLQITAPISPGSSGGPIINDKGLLVGVAVGGIVDGQNLNFSIPAKYVQAICSGKLELHVLDVSSSKAETKKVVNSDIKSSIIVRNLIWYAQTGLDAQTKLQLGYSSNYLDQFSVLNKLNYPIYNISLFFIMYDQQGIPVDYGSLLVAEDQGQAILPGLAKSFIAERITESGITRILDKKSGYSCEVRVLDFSVLND